MLVKTYDVEKACAAQTEFCEKTSSPHFAPNKGTCWCCQKNIYSPLGHKRGQSGSTWTGKTGFRRVESCPMDEAEYITGISVEEAGKALVTGCPHCNKSYCD